VQGFLLGYPEANGAEGPAASAFERRTGT